MKKFNFGKIFALMAAGAAVFALVFAGCEQLNGAIRNALEQPKTAEAAGADELMSAFADSSVKVVEIKDGIKADSLELSIAGDKTIYIPGGKETAIGSLELSAGSHVKIMNSSGGTAKSVGGALAAAYSEQNYDGWATLVIWNNFKIPAGATFDLTGKVRLIFSAAEVEGTLKAEIEDSLLGAGEEAPVITGGGEVQTSKDAEPKKPEQLAAADIKNSEEHKAPPQTLDPPVPPVPPGPFAITSESTGIMAKEETRQFSANRADVTWTVEGGSEEGGTSITAGGLLTVGAGEANITLTVKAESAGEDTKTETVKVKGWKTITGPAEIFDIDNIYGISYGADKWVAVGGRTAGGVGGNSKFVYSTDGESWTQGTAQLPSNKDGKVNNVVYDGPDGNKKFIALAENGLIYYSTDGMNWTGVLVDTSQDFDFEGAAYGNNMFIALGHSSVANKKIGIATSDDGASWTLKVAPGPLDSLKNVSGLGYQIAFHDGVFISAFGNYASIAKATKEDDMALVANGTISTPSIAFKGYTNVTTFASNSYLTKVIFTGDQWILTGSPNLIAFSSNTTSWAVINSATSAYKTRDLLPAYVGGKLVIVGSEGTGTSSYTGGLIYSTTIPLSTDSVWKTHEKIATNRNIFAFAYADNKLIVAGQYGWMVVAHEETLDE
jgi:hypothetical protein